jgi:hypothetical protein
MAPEGIMKIIGGRFFWEIGSRWAAVEKKTTFAASSPTSEICLWNLGCKAKKVRAADGASCLHTISAYSTEEASLLARP